MHYIVSICCVWIQTPEYIFDMSTYSNRVIISYHTKQQTPGTSSQWWNIQYPTQLYFQTSRIHGSRICHHCIHYYGSSLCR